tara:strand:+ start:114 stop:1865 length:1752 start_codon:yes stop_codon:yes gene_type:complete
MKNTLLFILFAVNSLVSVNSVWAKRPNIIVIMTDDQGIGDFGFANNSLAETPNLDALYEGGVHLEQFYVSPVCSPTRACLMTGRYNYRTRCIDTYLGRSMMDTNEITIAEVLGAAGYRTGIFGKWHLGDNYPLRAVDQGFEESLIHKGGGLAQPSEPRENGRRYTDAILFHNGNQVQSKGYCTDVYFDAAIEFANKASADGDPFFAYIPTNAPHGPFHDVPQELYEHYKQKDFSSIMVRDLNEKQRQAENDKLARIFAMITNVDQNIGRLIKALKSAGQLDNTMIVYLNDNGPNSARYVNGHRGSKATVLEGGVRSPLIVQWPSSIKPGTASNQVGAHIDLLPTIAEACGVKLAKGHEVDGMSLLTALTGEQRRTVERTLVIQSHRGNQPTRFHNFLIRKGDYKLVHPSGFGKESFEGEPQFELYNVVKDPSESNNLIGKEPKLARQLADLYEQWFDDVSSTRKDNYAPPRIVLGSQHDPIGVLTRQDWRDGTWASAANGYWLVSVDSAGAYNVKLVYDAAKTDESVKLEFGRSVIEDESSAGADELVFENVQLVPGPQKVQATLTQGDKSRGPYQIIVTKVK